MKYIKAYERLTTSEILDKIGDFFNEIVDTEYKHRTIRADDYLIMLFGINGYCCKFKNNKIIYCNTDIMNYFYPYLIEYLESKIPTIYEYKFDFNNVEKLELSKDEYMSFADSKKYNL